MSISKFRGKTADGEWVYGSLIKGTATNEKHPEGFTVAFIVPELPCASEPSDLWTVKMYRVDPDSVGQFTGCLDKHGNEVYEGGHCRCLECRKSLYAWTGTVCKLPFLHSAKWRERSYWALAPGTQSIHTKR